MSESVRPSDDAAFEDDELIATRKQIESSKKFEKRQRKTTLLLLLMTVSFYVSWTPYAINSILSMAGAILPRLFNIIALLCSKSGTVINPILYIFYNKSVSK